MKKILSVVLALALVCGLAVTAMAAGYDLSLDKTVIEPGDTVVVTITNQETYSDTMAQIELNYDWNILTYASSTVSDAYSSLPNWALTVSKKAAMIKMSWITFGVDPYEMPAGTVATITFTANEATTVAELGLNVRYKLDSGDTTVTTEDVKVTVCPNHNVVETVVEGSCIVEGYTTSACEACGHSETVVAGYNTDNHGEIKHVEAKTPSCYEEGNVEYWYCVDCGYAWTDEARTQVTNLKSVILPADCQNVQHVDAVAPGCHFEGNIEYWYCNDCGTVWQDAAHLQMTNIKNVILPATGGDEVHIEAVEPGCHYEGNIEYWYCEECEQVWQDEALTQLTNHMNVKLAVSHSIEHVEAKDPTCTESGNIEYWYCTICGSAWLDEYQHLNTNLLSVVVPAQCKNIVHVEAVEPACHFEGNIEYWYCADCLTVWQDEAMLQLTNFKNVIVPALGGDVVHVEAKAPTCTTEGNIEHWYCEECEQVWQDEALTQLTNHKNVMIATIDHVDANTDDVCDVCGADLSSAQTGDFTVVTVAAIALVSMMAVVALPVMKKKFF